MTNGERYLVRDNPTIMFLEVAKKIVYILKTKYYKEYFISNLQHYIYLW